MKTWPNWVDLIVVIVLLTTCYRGYIYGLLAELLHLIGAVSATAVSINYAPTIAAWIEQWWSWPNPTTLTFLVFLCVLLALVGVVHWLLQLLTKLLKWERLNWIFEIFGLALGGLRGLWWCGVLMLMLSVSHVSYLQASVEERSVIGPHLLPVSRESLEWVTGRFPGVQYRSKTLVPPLKANYAAHS